MQHVSGEILHFFLSVQQPTNGLTASATYVLPQNVAKVNGQSGKASKVIGKNKSSISSIITEDNSDDELPLPVPKNTKNKELFKYVH